MNINRIEKLHLTSFVKLHESLSDSKFVNWYVTKKQQELIDSGRYRIKILNIDNNILRGTGFYIDNTQAIFAGTINSNAGNIGGWTINPDKLSSPPDGSGYSRLIFSPSPLIAKNDTSVLAINCFHDIFATLHTGCNPKFFVFIKGAKICS